MITNSSHVDANLYSSTTPLLTAVTETPEKKQPLVLIRSHPKVYIAICYQLAQVSVFHVVFLISTYEQFQFMLAASIIICSLYVRPQALGYMARRIEKLHGDVVLFAKLISNVSF